MATIVKSLADLPNAESPKDERERRITEKLDRRERGRAEAQESTHAKKRERVQAERYRPLPKVTWLTEPVLLHPAKRVLVTGVCSDCDPAVAAIYGVRL